MIRVLRSLLILSLLLLTVLDAAAGTDTIPMPRYDVDSYCKDVSRSKTGLYDSPVYDICFDGEQVIYDWLKTIWPLMTEQSRHECENEVQSRGVAYYQHLFACLRWAEGNEQHFDTSEFKY